MPVNPEILGMVHHYPDTFVIGREQVRQYGWAIKADDPATFDEKAAAELGHDNLIAPLTFPAILALLVQKDFFRKFDVGLATMQIVQVDQSFVFHNQDCGRFRFAVLFVGIAKLSPVVFIRRKSRHHVHPANRHSPTPGLPARSAG